MFIFYDTETNEYSTKTGEKIHKLKMGMACRTRLRYPNFTTSDYWYKFTTPEQFWSFVLGTTYKKKKVYIISHNQHFDFNVVRGWEKLDELKVKLESFIIDSNKFILKFRIDSTTFIFCDSCNFVKISLKKIGEAVGIPKLEVDFKDVPDEELEIYCRRDVEIVREFIIQIVKFVKLNDLGCFKYTVAGLAFNAYRHRFMQKQIIIHNNDKAIALERKSYRGGRNEAFWIGKIPCREIYKLDINSQYPFVMKSFKYPVRLISYWKTDNMHYLQDAMSKYDVIANVNITINEPAIAVKADRLLFPIGTFDVALTMPELMYVKNVGKINSVSEYACYATDNIFNDYVDWFYKMRKYFDEEHQNAFSYMCKLYLNSLYGKFGEKYTIWDNVEMDFNGEVGIIDVFNFNDKTKSTYLVIGDEAYKKIGDTEAHNSFPAIASYVTSYARMYLYNLMRIADLKNVYYVDTDSLFTNKAGYDNLKPYINKLELGMLKLESVHSEIIIHGCKDYIIDGKKIVKGVKGDAIWLTDCSVKQDQWRKSLTALRKHEFEGVTVKEVTKHLERVYKKGTVTASGKVLPLVLPYPVP